MFEGLGHARMEEDAVTSAGAARKFFEAPSREQASAHRPRSVSLLI
jgi:hypothetical protein